MATKDVEEAGGILIIQEEEKASEKLCGTRTGTETSTLPHKDDSDSDDSDIDEDEERRRHCCYCCCCFIILIIILAICGPSAIMVIAHWFGEGLC